MPERITEGQTPEGVVNFEAFRKQREAVKQPGRPEGSPAFAPSVTAGIPGREIRREASEKLVTLGKVRHERDTEWLNGLHQRRWLANPDTRGEYAAWHLTDTEWTRAKRTDPTLTHHMQVEDRIAALQRQANGDEKLFSKLWQEELVAMRRRDQQERAADEAKNRSLSQDAKRQQIQETALAASEPKPSVIDTVFEFFETLVTETRSMLEKLKYTPEAKS